MLQDMSCGQKKTERVGEQLMEVIRDKDVWHIIRRTLERVDPRVVGHGERVAYIAQKLLKRRDAGKRERQDIMLLGLMHDIGAYKTEEIDRMLEFENGRVSEHAAYGYLYLKNLSPLSSQAEAILYHHLPYRSLPRVKCCCPDLACVLSLSDRIDMGLFYGKGGFESSLVAEKGKRFSPQMVDLFFQVQAEEDIVGKLKSGAYRKEVEDLTEQFTFSVAEKQMVLQMIAYAIDFRSEHMVLHTAATVSVSVAIARQLRLSSEETEQLYYGALLHDIGKVATPVEILEKPGRLTGPEMEIMKQHVVISGEILDGLVWPSVCRMAVRHHEKMDGSGYPLGLRGEELSQSERIVAVADIISALIRKRSYKEEMGKEEVVRILEQMRDTGKICPMVTREVLDHYDNILSDAEKSSHEITRIYRRIQENFESTVQKLEEAAAQ